MSFIHTNSLTYDNLLRVMNAMLKRPSVSPPACVVDERALSRIVRLHAASTEDTVEGGVAATKLKAFLAARGWEFSAMSKNPDAGYCLAVVRECSGVEVALVRGAWWVCGTSDQVRDARAMADHMSDQFAAAWARCEREVARSRESAFVVGNVFGNVLAADAKRAMFAAILNEAENDLDRGAFMVGLGRASYEAVCGAFGRQRPPPPAVRDSLQKQSERAYGASAPQRQTPEADAETGAPRARQEPASDHAQRAAVNAQERFNRSVQRAMAYAAGCRPLALLFRLRPMLPTLPPHDPRPVDGCSSCAEEYPRYECHASKRTCGHHCNHAWSHESCCWCGAEGTDLDIPATE